MRRGNDDRSSRTVTVRLTLTLLIPSCPVPTQVTTACGGPGAGDAGGTAAGSVKWARKMPLSRAVTAIGPSPHARST
nr:hypothetical protein StreXyl84_06730 [Streptomyces sp. Xyl84]